MVTFSASKEKSMLNFLVMDGGGSEDKPLNIPKEVWILVNHLFTRSCDQVRMLKLDKMTTHNGFVFIIQKKNRLVC